MSSCTITFAVNALSVSASADTIQTHLNKVTGIQKVTVSTAIRTMDVTFDDAVIDPDGIIKAIQACGYDACLLHEEIPDTLKTEKKTDLKTMLSLSIALAAPLAHFLPHSTLFVMVILAVLLCLQKEQVINCLKHLRQKQWDDASATAILLLAFLPVMLILFIIKQPVSSLSTAWTAVLGIRLSTMHVFLDAEEKEQEAFKPEPLHQKIHLYKDGHEITIHPDNLKEGEIIILRNHDVIPADSTITEGTIRIVHMQETSEKHTGDKLYAGDTVSHGYCTCKVEKTGRDTAIAKLWQKTRDNGETIPETSHSLQKKIIYISTGMLLIIFLVSLLVTKQLAIALTASLAIAAGICPCALSKAVRKTYLSTSLTAAENNLFFKSARSLQNANIQTIFLEQDDIITSHQLTITDFIPGRDIDQNIMEMDAGDAISHCHDSFAKALQAYLRTQKLTAASAGAFCRIKKEGSEKTIRLDTPAAVKKAHIDTSVWNTQIDTLIIDGKDVRLLQDGSHIISIIAARKQILPHAKEAISSLQSQGMHVVLFVHGSHDFAKYLQKETGVDEVHCQYSWIQKEQAMTEEKEHGKACAYVYSIPLARHNADLLIRMHGMQDESSDLIIPGNDPAVLPEIFQYQKQMQQTIEKKQKAILYYHGIIIAVGLFSAIFVHSLFVPYLLSIANAIFLSTKQ
ncbi:MAG: cation transporter [Lactimicrobium sp.]|uniref:P-type ATPase n=1 Tax=Lactimicrobium sp. TaxID=2563780 RepID=UPI002F350A6B